MPNSYPVNWAPPAEMTQFTDSAKMFMAARDKERARRLAEDQERYKREQDAIENQRNAVKDALEAQRAKAADEWQADRHKLDVQAAKQKEAEFKLDMRTRQQKEALEKGEQFLATNPGGAAEVAKYAATPETSDNYASAPPDAAAQMPAPVQQEAVPGIEPGAAPLAQAQTLSPIQMAQARRAEEKRKQDEVIALYGEKQKAELASSETIAAAQIRAAAAVAAAAGKGPQPGELTTQQYQRLMGITNKFQADRVANMAQQGRTVSAIADSVIANPNSATSQLTSLYLLVKNLDPDSAVREGELDLAKQTQSYQQQFSQMLTRLSKGQVLDPAAATDLAKATKALAGKWAEAGARRAKQYKSQAGVLGLGKQFDEYLANSGTQEPEMPADGGGEAQWERGPDGKPRRKQ